MERLTGIISYCSFTYCDNEGKCKIENVCYDKQLYEKLKNYEDLEEQGRLIKLPCKVGDTVYVISSRCNGEEIDDEWCKTHDCDNCAFVYETKATKYLLYQLWKGNNKTYIFGKTIFLTKAEAEKALAEMGE